MYLSSWIIIVKYCLFTKSLFKWEARSVSYWKKSETKRNKEQALKVHLPPPKERSHGSMEIHSDTASLTLLMIDY